MTRTIADPVQSKQRRPYTSPRLISYGHVKDIVQGSSGTMNDSGTTKGCWVAEALYGVDDSRTLLVRAWLIKIYTERRRGRWLVGFYRRVGPTVADLIRAGYVPRRALLPLFDFLTGKASDEWARIVRYERFDRH
jgi:hypothetical protein